MHNKEDDMATTSFTEMLEIDTPEKAERLVEAFRAAERRGPRRSEIDISEELKKGEELIRRMTL